MTVFYGVVISVLLTLLVVPAVYALVARNTGSPQDVTHRLERLRQAGSLKGRPADPQVSDK